MQNTPLAVADGGSARCRHVFTTSYKHIGGGDDTYGSLVKTVRTAKGPSHERGTPLGAHLSRFWEPQPTFAADIAVADVEYRRLARGTDARRFCRVYQALALWRCLGLHEWRKKLLPVRQEQVSGQLVACVLWVARLCAPLSELAATEHWYADATLAELLGVAVAKINETRLYRGWKVLLQPQEALGRNLWERSQLVVDWSF